MIYTYSDIFGSGRLCIAGYIRDNGTVVTLWDLVTSPLAYNELCDKFGVKPELVIPENVQILQLAINDSGSPVFDLLADYASDTVEFKLIEGATRIMSHMDSIQLHSSFKQILPQGAAANAFLREHSRRTTDLKDTVMLAPTDELAFSVPTYEELYAVYNKAAQQDDDSDEDSDDSGSMNLIALAMSAQAAGDQLTSNFGGDAVSNLAGMLNARPTFGDLDPHIDLEYIKVNQSFPYYDSIHFRDILQNPRCAYNIPESYIAGDPANNLLPIQPNEQRYYDALVARIREGIAIEQGLVTDEEIDNCIDQGITSTIVNMYLTDMARLAFRLNWTHTGSVVIPVEETAGDSDSDSEESAEGAFPGYYTFDFIKGERVSCSSELQVKVNNYEFIDGFSRVKQYVDYTTLNSYKWAEALIRLLRWGERKPSCLCIKNYSSDRQEYLDLNSLEPTTFAGTLEDLKPVINDDGSHYTLAGGIWLGYNKEIIEDVEGLNRVTGYELEESPKFLAGIILRTNYVGAEIYRLEFMDIFTAVSQLMSGEIKIQGVAIENNKFKIQPELQNVLSDSAIPLSEVLSPSMPKCVLVTAPSIQLTKTLIALRSRKNIGTVDTGIVNVFRIIRNMYSTSNYEFMVDTENKLSAADSTSWDELSKSILDKTSGKTEIDLIVDVLTDSICRPFIVYSMELQKLSSEPKELSTSVLLDTAWDIRVLQDQNISPARRTAPKMPLNALFTSLINKAQKKYQIVAKLPNEDQHTVAGYFAIYKTVEGRQQFLFWTIDEYTPEILPTSRIGVDAFYDQVFSKYMQVVNTGNLDRYKQLFIPATDDTMVKLGKACFSLRQKPAK